MDRRVKDIQEILDAHKRRLERMEQNLGRNIPHSYYTRSYSHRNKNICAILIVAGALIISWKLYSFANGQWLIATTAFSTYPILEAMKVWFSSGLSVIGIGALMLFLWIFIFNCLLALARND